MVDFDSSRRYHHRYPFLMGGAHKKPVTPIGTPAITQHLAFWAPDEPAISHDDWIWNIETFVLHLYDELAERNRRDRDTNLQMANLRKEKNGRKKHFYLLDHRYSSAKRVPAPLDEPERFKTVYIDFTWESLPVQLRLELHNEYFTLSSTIDLSRWNIPEGKQSKTARELNAAIEAFNAFATTRYRDVADGKRRIETDHDRATLENCYNTIYHTVWEQLHDGILSSSFNAVSPEQLGRIFADFRSFVANCGKDSFISQPGKVPPARKLAKEPFSASEIIYRMETMRPFIALSGEPKEQLEYTFSQVQNGCGILASALGATPAVLQREHRPVTDMFLMTHGDPGQIGRLVDRGHALGTLRVAALYDLDKIIQANQDLRGIAARLKQLGEQPPALMDMGALVETFRDLVRIEESVPGGLGHRVERSAYYRRQFFEHVDGLRLNRIEGSQPYDVFVRRRLGPSYELIDAVGRRRDRIVLDRRDLERQAQVAGSLKLQGYIGDQIRSIENLQRAAEFGFYQVLTPYYLGSIILDMTHHHYAVPIMASTFAFGTYMANRERIREFHKHARELTLSSSLRVYGAIGRLNVTTDKNLFIPVRKKWNRAKESASRAQVKVRRRAKKIYNSLRPR